MPHAGQRVGSHLVVLALLALRLGPGPLHRLYRRERLPCKGPASGRLNPRRLVRLVAPQNPVTRVAKTERPTSESGVPHRR